MKFILLCFYFNIFRASLIPHFFNTSKIHYESGKLTDVFDINEIKRNQVKDSFLHAWRGYKKYAWGKDELKPLTNSSHERYQNWGATLVDSLTTLWIMDLKEEFDEALKQVEKIDFTKAKDGINFFESTIRYLGGLIGAYDLSGEKILLKKAVILADHLILAFDTLNGFPSNKLNSHFRPMENEPCLAEVGTIQLEFTRLSQITGNSKYADITQEILIRLHNMPKSHKGLYPLTLSQYERKFTTKEISFGALGDSFYEYLIKLYILTGKKHRLFKTMYEESMEGLLTLVRTDFHGYKYIGKIDVSGEFNPAMDHLALFVPGMLQYGDYVLGEKKYSDLALELVETGFAIYNSTPTCLGPEVVEFRSDRGFIITDPTNILRPELLESLYYSYRFTKNTKYRDYAWKIFLGLEKFSKTGSGFSGYDNVNTIKKELHQKDVLESFFFAETMKYMYLIFCDPNKIDLTKWVFTTEGHPLKIQK